MLHAYYDASLRVQVIQCTAFAASADTLVKLQQHLQPNSTAADSDKQLDQRSQGVQGSRLSKAVCILDRSLQVVLICLLFACYNAVMMKALVRHAVCMVTSLHIAKSIR